MRRFAFAVALAALLPAVSHAQQTASRHRADESGKPAAAGAEAAPSAHAEEARENKVTDADIAAAPVHERRIASHHTVTVNGKVIGYEASAGTLTLRDDSGKVRRTLLRDERMGWLQENRAFRIIPASAPPKAK